MCETVLHQVPYLCASVRLLQIVSNDDRIELNLAVIAA